MPITDRGSTLGPGFERRLKIALDAVVPSAPLFAHYFLATPGQSKRPWRFASALVGIGAVGIMAMSAAAATGSPNPAVWGQKAASTIQSVSHIPETTPSPPPIPTPVAPPAAPVVQQSGTSYATASPAHQTVPSDKPQPTDRPVESPPADKTKPPDESPPPPDPKEHPSRSPSASDQPGQNPRQDPHSSPPPDDHGGGSHGH